MEKQDRGTGIAEFLSLKYGRWIVGALLAACLGNAAAQTVRWEDYRGNSRVGTTYTGPAGAPTFANNTGTGADRLNALRAIAANPANAVRTGMAADINYRQAANHLCNLDSAATSVASCNLQAMGRVSYALVQFPAAGTYTVSIAHDDNVELGFSSDYANTSYRTASYDVPVGTVNDWTANEDTYVSLGSFTAANANSCALVRMYWLNHGGINHARVRWTLPGSGTPVIIPSTAFRDPAAYFHRYAHLSPHEARAKALEIWRTINEKNLFENILPTRQRSRLILRKGANHRIESVALPRIWAGHAQRP